MKLRSLDLLRVFARSFWIQALWTVQRGQNLGCVYSLWPVLRRLYPDVRDRAPSALAHSAYFSTHPYTAGVVLGVISGVEEERSSRGESDSGAVVAMRSAMSGPFAALGEAFFWSTWRPLCFLLASLSALAAGAPVWLPAVLFVASYNALHLAARAAGFWAGYRYKTAVVEKLAHLRLQKALLPLALAGFAGTAAILCAAVWRHAVGAWSLLWAAVFWLVLRLGIPLPWLLAGSAAASVLFYTVRPG